MASTELAASVGSHDFAGLKKQSDVTQDLGMTHMKLGLGVATPTITTVHQN